MEIHYTPFSFHAYKHKNQNISSSWARRSQQSLHFYFKSRISYDGCAECNLHLPKITRRFSISASKPNKSYTEKYGEEDLVDNVSKKEGTIAGAVALIIGTSIGSGILALPQKTSPAGLLPSSTTLTVCWAFLLIEALLLVEINVALMRKRRINEDEFEVISIRTMAQETLGEWGGIFSTVIYVFLGYSSMVAYNSKSGEIINHLINIPYPVSGLLFPVLFGVLVSLGGTRATDQVNQWLTASMIGLLLAIEILAVVLGGWTGLEGSGDWGKVPPTIPVIIFSLVYHDLAPVLCAYLGGDLQRIRTSVLLGSIVPLLALLVWNAIALGLSSHANQVVDPIELLVSMKQSRISFMVETFSLLAVGTSLIGTLLGFSEFFKEQINELSRNSLSGKSQQEQFGLKKWWRKNKVTFTAITLVIVPSIAVSTTVPDAFSVCFCLTYRDRTRLPFCIFFVGLLKYQSR